MKYCKNATNNILPYLNYLWAEEISKKFCFHILKTVYSIQINGFSVCHYLQNNFTHIFIVNLWLSYSLLS